MRILAVYSLRAAKAAPCPSSYGDGARHTVKIFRNENAQAVDYTRCKDRISNAVKPHFSLRPARANALDICMYVQMPAEV